MTLARRLRLLEQNKRTPTVRVILIYWADELATCSEHFSCGIERSTGLHHAIIRLGWDVQS
jgi:hypothetical protein